MVSNVSNRTKLRRQVRLLMSYDYFLTHRALQIQNLCSRTEGNRIAIPNRHSRSGLSRELNQLLKSIDRICRLELGDSNRRDLVTWMKKALTFRRGVDENAGSGMLNDRQRALLWDFERDVVRVRFSQDETSAKAASRIMRALLSDQAFFCGLKPLPQHSDAFPYETLFPTWFNLHTAMVQPMQDRKDPGFSQQQREIVFRFLDHVRTRLEDHEPTCVAILTLIAHRFDAPRSHELMQRAIDIVLDDESCLQVLQLTLNDCTTVASLIDHVQAFVTVRSCLRRGDGRTDFDVAGKSIPRPDVPSTLRDRLSEFPRDPEEAEAYWNMTRAAGKILDQAGGFDSSLAELLNEHPDQSMDLLNLIAPPREGADCLNARGQELVAETARREASSDGAVPIERIARFAFDVAPHLGQAHLAAARFFQTEFIGKRKNRQAMLTRCAGPETRARLSAELIKAAAKSDDTARFLQLLSIAAAFDSTRDNRILQQNLSVLDRVRRDESIGKRELSDLMEDLRGHLPESASYLESPIQVAVTKPERLAKIYLALNEECEVYRHTGRVSNFGVTRASFSHLTRLVDEDESDTDK